jgi:hypothetical protein
MNISETNLAREKVDSQSVESLPVFEIRRNPFTRLYAVFYKVGPKGEWKELTRNGISMLGEPSIPEKLRSRFRFRARWRLCSLVAWFWRRDQEKRTKDIYLANRPS